MKYTAKQVGSDFHLYQPSMDVPFGKLVDCEVCHIFQSPDQQLEYYVNEALEGDMSIREMLAVIRTEKDELDIQQAAEAKADIETERRTEIYYEGGYADDACHAENQADLELHDHLHPFGYGV